LATLSAMIRSLRALSTSAATSSNPIPARRDCTGRELVVDSSTNPGAPGLHLAADFAHQLLAEAAKLGWRVRHAAMNQPLALEIGRVQIAIANMHVCAYKDHCCLPFHRWPETRPLVRKSVPGETALS